MARTWKQVKDTREMSYYIENGVYPCEINGYKGMLFMKFYQDEINDLSENWYSAIEMYKQERDNYKQRKY